MGGGSGGSRNEEEESSYYCNERVSGVRMPFVLNSLLRHHHPHPTPIEGRAPLGSTPLWMLANPGIIRPGCRFEWRQLSGTVYWGLSVSGP